MLDSDTKQKIDSLRNILVGKIPNPQSQVEQITTGLIYKFMHDMDQESIEMGGEGSFFVGDYEKYSWNNLFDTKLSGVDKVKLYSDAIEGMYLNPSAPELFRNIFKNAFLPFKDPSTLNMFLKEVNEFHYSHSEKLGDAFEYLISIMGSQGDAGQFRTPRHIIDFIVEIINPQKHETVLDPACGTGGFLISSYKHILKTNTDKKLGDLLSASDRKKVGENIGGYDISPEMIKLSLVNMYLHGFSTPDIEEYDTLSSEDNWNKYYDVILANPPFFSPSGGIQPHKRFGVESKKAEVLFTSYILEHLKPNGRAGIIIPEGIIFQTGKAYKELRKQLIENGLVGVISLPAGVFNPYAGVKTSILILDKKLNKESDSIFFAEVKNDGFDLGAQRGPIKENDLPQISTAIASGKEIDDIIFHIKKEIILKDKSYALTSRKYKEVEEVNSNYPVVPISEVYKVISPPVKIKSKEFLTNGKVPIIDQSQDQIAGYWNNEEDRVVVENSVIIFGDHTKSIKFVDFDFVAGADGIKILNPSDEILPKFLFYIIKSIKLPELGYSRHYKELKDKKIPLPTVEVQQEIVDELEGYQKIIDGCTQVVENYKPTIDIDPSWEVVELGEICELISGQSPASKYYNENNDGLPFYQGKTEFGDIYLKETKIYTSSITKTSQKGDIVMSVRAPVGPVNLPTKEICIGRGLCAIRPKKDQDLVYLFNILQVKGIVAGHMGATYESINRDELKGTKIPYPNEKLKTEIVEYILEERKVIEGNKKLIETYTQKIQDRINKVWGED
ncbi:N-6 DNA methylase [Gammaproteobacteria bacterium]|nr:N-6 DNA methylase [Gammaproteobacteria bacterium]